MNAAITLLLVDDHALMRESLSRRLASESGIHVLGESSNAAEALSIVPHLKPDIVIMDIDMPGMDCFEAANHINQTTECQVIFLSAFWHDTYIERAIAAQAKGYLTKSEPTSKLVDAIRHVARGRVFFSEEVRSRIIIDKRRAKLSVAEKARTRKMSLSPREVEVLRYLSRGMTKKEIAPVMDISIKTVDGYTEKLMNKLDIHDRVELTRYAIREGLAEC